MRHYSRSESAKDNSCSLAPASETSFSENVGDGGCGVKKEFPEDLSRLSSEINILAAKSPLAAKLCRLFFPLLTFCERAKKPLFIKIDGRCASGKTTLSELLCSLFDCTVIHMDDFFLPAGRSPENDMGIPGGNIEYSRLRNDVLLPLLGGNPAKYTAYDCSSGTYGTPQLSSPSPITVLEGAYSLHPALGSECGLSVFLTVSKQEQRQRILGRSSNSDAFFDRWIPMEERYFEISGIAEHCDFVFDTSEQ